MCLNLQKVKVHDNYKKYRGILVHSYNDYQLLPCGKCYQCQEAKIEEWEIRWANELKYSQPNSSYLITLTYNDKNLPLLINDEGEYITTLQYEDVQKFLKRLRKRQDKICKLQNIENPKISYHCCGEYGTQFTKRPHYHMLITNLLVNPEEIQSIWKNGLVHIGNNVTEKTIKYVLKYTLKNALNNYNLKIHKHYKEVVQIVKGNAFDLKYPIEVYHKLGVIVHNPQIKDYEIVQKKLLYKTYLNGKNKNRVVEKTLCSKGIGKKWLTEDNIKIYRDNPRLNYLHYDEKKSKYKEKPLPRYYKENIFNPKMRDDNGKLIKDDHNRSISLWSPLLPGYENTPRFKKQLHTFQRTQELLNMSINLLGINGIKQKHECNLLNSKYNQEKFTIRQNIQSHKNKHLGISELI